MSCAFCCSSAYLSFLEALLQYVLSPAGSVPAQSTQEQIRVTAAASLHTPRSQDFRMDYKKIADEISQKILSYHEDNSGWTLAKSNGDISVSWRPSNEYSGNIYRGEGTIEEVPEKIIPFMYIDEHRMKWDKAQKYYSIVENIDQDTAICRTITHSYGFGLISSREFVDLVHIRRYDGGVITTNSVSIEYEKLPVTPEYIRGFNHPCGYICSPLPENPAHSKLVVFIQAELGGLLPRAVVESALPNNVISLFTNVREGLKKFYKDN